MECFIAAKYIGKPAPTITGFTTTYSNMEVTYANIEQIVVKMVSILVYLTYRT